MIHDAFKQITAFIKDHPADCQSAVLLSYLSQLSSADEKESSLLTLLQSFSGEALLYARLAICLSIIQDNLLSEKLPALEAAQQAQFISTTLLTSQDQLNQRTLDLTHLDIGKLANIADKFKALCFLLENVHALVIKISFHHSLYKTSHYPAIRKAFANNQTLCRVRGLRSSVVSSREIKNNLNFFATDMPIKPVKEKNLAADQLSYRYADIPLLVEHDDIHGDTGEILSPEVIATIKQQPQPQQGSVSKIAQRAFYKFSNAELPHRLVFTPAGCLSVYYYSKKNKLTSRPAHLGAGLYGCVKVAKLIGKNQWFAVKIFRMDKRGYHEKDFYKVVLTEARTLLETRQLLAIYLRDDKEMQCEIIMSLKKGVNLDTFVTTCKEKAYLLKTDCRLQLAEIALKMARALQALHQYGILHRDLHLGNFLYHATSRRVFLIDYSFCIMMNSQRMVSTKRWRGDIHFAPPEIRYDMQSKQRLVFTEKTDIYWLGRQYLQLFSDVDNSDLFKKLALVLLSDDPDKRFSLSEVISSLLHYHSLIRTHTPPAPVSKVGLIDVAAYMAMPLSERIKLISSRIKLFCLMTHPEHRPNMSTIHQIRQDIHKRNGIVSRHILLNTGADRVPQFLSFLSTVNPFKGQALELEDLTKQSKGNLNTSTLNTP